MDMVSEWPDGTNFSVVSQVEFARANRKAVANV